MEEMEKKERKHKQELQQLQEGVCVGRFHERNILLINFVKNYGVKFYNF